MKEWSKSIGNRLEMLAQGECWLLDINTIYYNCEIDEIGIMFDINNALTEDK